MTIETKYNLYDEVWLMYKEKPVKSVITGLMFIRSTNLSSLVKQNTYSLNTTSSGDTLRNEESLFSTKEELLASL